LEASSSAAALLASTKLVLLLALDAPALPRVPRPVGSLKSPWSSGMRLMYPLRVTTTTCAPTREGF
jgi:hypothetical protein